MMVAGSENVRILPSSENNNYQQHSLGGKVDLPMVLSGSRQDPTLVSNSVCVICRMDRLSSYT